MFYIKSAGDLSKSSKNVNNENIYPLRLMNIYEVELTERFIILQVFFFCNFKRALVNHPIAKRQFTETL